MQALVERGCGLDVHQATVVACLLIVPKNGKIQKQIRTFGTTMRAAELARMGALGRLHACGKESTGVRRKPIYTFLEGVGDRGGQCTTRREGSGAQDRREGRGIDRGLALPRVTALQLRSA
jgi:hypothetical protein